MMERWVLKDEDGVVDMGGDDRENLSRDHDDGKDDDKNKDRDDDKDKDKGDDQEPATYSTLVGHWTRVAIQVHKATHH